jgi:hypothetical protein
MTNLFVTFHLSYHFGYVKEKSYQIENGPKPTFQKTIIKKTN